MADKEDVQPWYQLDLGKVEKVKEVTVAFVHPVYGHAFRLEKSLDGENWETVAERPTPEVKTPHQVEDIGKARYLKVTVLEGHPGIWEVKVY